MYVRYVQLKLSYATFQRNVEIGSHKAGGRLIQVWVIINAMWREITTYIKVTQYKLLLDRGGH